MNKFALLFLSSILSISLFGQIRIDAKEFTSSFQEVFDASIAGLKKIEKQAPSIEGSSSAGIYLDEAKEIYIYRAEYKVLTRDEAQELKKELARQVLLNLPDGDYKHKESYGSEYHDYLKYTFEYDTTTFAEVKKRPIVQIGILKKDNDYQVELLILEPYFKNQY